MPTIADLCRRALLPSRLVLLTALFGSWLGWGVSEGRAIDVAAADAAGVQFAQEIYGFHPGSGSESSASMYRALYWMHVSVEAGVGPMQAAMRAQARVKGNAVYGPLEVQLCTDLATAEGLGLFTPDNLSRLQIGTAPVATRGPYAGRRVLVAKIRPTDPDDSLLNAALCVENASLDGEAIARGNLPNPTPAAPRQMLSPVAGMATSASATILHPAAPTPPPYRQAGGAMVFPQTSQTQVASEYAAHDPTAHIQLSDLPANGMLPIGGRLKLGIAGVQNNEISVSIIGDHEVIVKGLAGLRSTSHPSVDNFKVPKVNPVRLPGVSGNAYLIHTVPASLYGQEMRWFYVDTSVDNDFVYRIARVIGPL